MAVAIAHECDGGSQCTCNSTNKRMVKPILRWPILKRKAMCAHKFRILPLLLDAWQHVAILGTKKKEFRIEGAYQTVKISSMLCRSQAGNRPSYGQSLCIEFCTATEVTQCSRIIKTC